MSDGPRLLRPVGAPLGLYLRPGRNDHKTLLALLAEKRADMSGLVLDPCLADRHKELQTEARSHGLETVLDPRSVELATVGGITRSGITDLPWTGQTYPHTAEMLGGTTGVHIAEQIAQYANEKNFSAVLAPAHYVKDSLDPWLTIDARLTRALRRALDTTGRQQTCIYYPLAISATALRNPLARRALIAGLGQLPIDALWLRVHPFGTTSSGPLALRRYIEACQEFQSLGIPLVAEHTGTIGVALLAFGAVGGIESGVTYGERYDVSGLIKPPKSGSAFSPAPRVYIPKLGAFLSRAQASVFFANRQMKSLFACRADDCCRNGAQDMSADPRRHFLLSRTREVSYYSRPPVPVRPGLYLEEFLRPATDLALRATRVSSDLEPTRRRLEGWRNTLGALHQRGLPTTIAVAPEGQRIQSRQQIA